MLHLKYITQIYDHLIINGPYRTAVSGLTFKSVRFEIVWRIKYNSTKHGMYLTWNSKNWLLFRFLRIASETRMRIILFGFLSFVNATVKIRLIKWGASSRWSFRPNFVWAPWRGRLSGKHTQLQESMVTFFISKLFSYAQLAKQSTFTIKPLNRSCFLVKKLIAE